MKRFPIPRFDKHENVTKLILPFCRLKPGEIWTDPQGKHRIGCLDAADPSHIVSLMNGQKASLAVHDPPYNLIAFEERDLDSFIEWCGRWIDMTNASLADNSSLYVWLGADQKNGFEPLPDFMLLLRTKTDFKTRSFITMRNQRGYGTQKNWMAVRQELLYYIKGSPKFNVESEYTDIPKILRGYYKEIDGELTENFERSKSENIRAGNVWVDVQQVFYRMEENVNGCYAQKPLKSIDRIVRASSQPGELVIDFFSHAGTTLIACERLERRCNTIDIDPIFCEISIRRLARLRKNGETGWQDSNPFEKELEDLGITGFDDDGEPIYSRTGAATATENSVTPNKSEQLGLFDTE